MSRPLRIEYNGAWYHVMNRGANKQDIFLKNDHFHIFINILKDISSLFLAEIHGYCLMNNHYHLLIHTPLANLSRIMRHLDGVYTQRFNRSTGRDGPLFRGRYKALLIEHDAYLLQVSKYIHLNPIEANIAKNPLDYKWSSYSVYAGKGKQCEWLHTKEILKQVNGQKSYKDYMKQDLDKETKELYEKKYLPAILGSKSFKEKCLATLKHEKTKESLPDIKRTKDIPSITTTIEKIAAYFNISCEEIIFSKRRTENLPRLFSMMVCRLVFGYKFSEIATCLKGIKPRSISANTKRGVDRLNTNQKLRKQYDQLLKAIL